MSNLINYSDWRNELNLIGVDMTPSELHGMVVGYLCASRNSGPDQRRALFNGWLGGETSQSMISRLETIYKHAEDSLDEYSDFNFRLLMPDDEESIQSRAKALANWCSGFLSGFGDAGTVSGDSLTGDVAEAFNDLAKIAAIHDEIPDSEENEADLAEIEEFIRISMLMIYAETTSTPARH